MLNTTRSGSRAISINAGRMVCGPRADDTCKGMVRCFPVSCPTRRTPWAARAHRDLNLTLISVTRGGPSTQSSDKGVISDMGRAVGIQALQTEVWSGCQLSCCPVFPTKWGLVDISRIRAMTTAPMLRIIKLQDLRKGRVEGYAHEGRSRIRWQRPQEHTQDAVVCFLNHLQSMGDIRDRNRTPARLSARVLAEAVRSASRRARSTVR